MTVWLSCEKNHIALYENDIKKVSKKLTRKKVQERFAIRKLLFIIFIVHDSGYRYDIDKNLATEILASLKFGKRYSESTEYKMILELFNFSIDNDINICVYLSG